MTSLPILPFDHVFHIGTLNVEDRSRNYRDSYEGNCLSVSVTPHAWEMIAKLGGYDLHKLTKEGGQLVNLLETKKSDVFNEIVAWGRENGLVEDVEAHQGWEFDEDMEEWRYSIYPSFEAAMNELDMFDHYEGDASQLPSPEGHDAIELVSILRGTTKLGEIVGREFNDDEAADDYLIMAYALQHTDVDGVWWDEDFNPDSYSAPRGGIFPGKLKEWKSVDCDFEEVDDQEEMLKYFEKFAEDHNVPAF